MLNLITFIALNPICPKGEQLSKALSLEGEGRVREK
jgi:hypothetical protein